LSFKRSEYFDPGRSDPPTLSSIRAGHDSACQPLQINKHARHNTNMPATTATNKQTRPAWTVRHSFSAPTPCVPFPFPAPCVSFPAPAPAPCVSFKLLQVRCPFIQVNYPLLCCYLLTITILQYNQLHDATPNHLAMPTTLLRFTLSIHHVRHTPRYPSHEAGLHTILRTWPW